VTSRRFNLLQREPLLLAALVVVIAAFFAATTLAAHAYHRKQEQFAQQWFAQGEEALKQGRAHEAVTDFRNALAYSRDNDLYRLRLAQALMAEDRLQEARAHLLSLWEKEPGDGTVNLELARLAVKWNDTQQALRYYHQAIYGIWPTEAADRRLQIRFELSEYLLQHKDVEDVQAELVALAADVPPGDSAAQTRLGNLLLAAHLYGRALATFRTALADQPNLLPALAGAGEAAFQLGDYWTARHYLLPVVAQNPQDQHAAELLEVADLVIKLNPFERGLPSTERARRAVQDFQFALARAEKCAAPSGDLSSLLQQAEAKKMAVRESVLARRPDALEPTMDLVFKMEKASAGCAPASNEDQALQLLAARWETSR
jgi:tetratricopeptide (TPR) repeat protein